MKASCSKAPYQPVETGYVKLTASSATDAFGTSVAISGGAGDLAALTDLTVVVGAPNAASYTGAAYVFTFGSDNVAVETKLTASDGGTYENFGTSVATDGNFVAVGSNAADGLSYSTGAVYVFMRNASGAWPIQSKLFPPAGELFDSFGNSVSISGDYMVVGAPEHVSIGAVYVYKYDGTEWNLHHKISAPEGDDSQSFGESVSISGTLIVVGAPSFDTARGDSSGRAYLFTVDGNREQTFNGVDGTDYDNFGKQVSINGGVIAIAAPGNDGTVLSKSRKLLGSVSKGAVYIFERRTEGGYDTNKVMAEDKVELDYFGSSVAISGDYFIAGAYGVDTATSSDYDDDQGAAYISSVRHTSTGTVGGDGCSLCDGPNDEVFVATCGFLSVKTDKFSCTSDIICCAPSSGDCCELNAGALAGLVIGIVVFLALSITGCAYCCKCCCFSRPAAASIVVHQQPAGIMMAPVASTQPAVGFGQPATDGQPGLYQPGQPSAYPGPPAAYPAPPYPGAK